MEPLLIGFVFFSCSQNNAHSRLYAFFITNIHPIRVWCLHRDFPKIVLPYDDEIYYNKNSVKKENSED